MKSQLKDHIRLTELVRGNHYEGVVSHLRKFPNILKEVCADNNKGHCNYNPLYAALSGPVVRMTEPFIDYALSQNPDLLNIITYRADLLSYLVGNKDEPTLVQKLIDEGLDVNNQNDYTDMNFRIYKPTFNTPAHTAVIRGHLESLKVLIENGADLSLLNKGNATPLDVYFYNSYRLDDEFVEVLVNAKADVSYNQFGYSTSLTRAINGKEWGALDELLGYTKAKLSKFQLDKMVRKLSESEEVGELEQSVLNKALDHMADDFDNQKYMESICKSVANVAVCKDLFSNNAPEVMAEPIVSGVDFMDLEAFSALVSDTLHETVDV